MNLFSLLPIYDCLKEVLDSLNYKSKDYETLIIFYFKELDKYMFFLFMFKEF